MAVKGREVLPDFQISSFSEYLIKARNKLGFDEGDTYFGMIVQQVS
jgi:hypothetical protein